MLETTIDGNEPDWLMADFDGERVALGLARPSGLPVVHSVRTYRSDDFATATDCLMGYAAELGIDLKGRRAAIVVAGAVGDDVVRLARTRWTLSIHGFGFLLGHRPFVISTGVAKSWSNLDHSSATHSLLSGVGTIDFGVTGKWTSIKYQGGLTASMLRRFDDGNLRAMESECGHVGFSPRGALQRELADALARSNPRVTPERMLFVAVDDPVWDGLSQQTTRAGREAVRADMLGAFVGDVVLHFASWSGVFLNGDQFQFLVKAENRAAFDKAFEDKGHFRPNIRAVPRWIVKGEQNNLPGAARMLASRLMPG